VGKDYIIWAKGVHRIFIVGDAAMGERKKLKENWAIRRR
jgi:hypothetical protein